MKISIVIPTLNEAECLGYLLQTIKQHNREHVKEIIVADGGSTDGTREIAEDHGAHVIPCEHAGRGFQMNAGAEAAKGELLFFLHADTIPPRDFDLMITDAVLDGYSSGCFRLAFDDDHPLLRFFGWCTRFDFNFIRFGDQSLFLSREFFQAVGGFDESLMVMEDQDMVHRIRKANNRFRIIDKQVITSARKYRDNGIIRLQIIFSLIWLLYYSGARQETLLHCYRSLIRHRLFPFG